MAISSEHTDAQSCCNRLMTLDEEAIIEQYRRLDAGTMPREPRATDRTKDRNDCRWSPTRDRLDWLRPRASVGVASGADCSPRTTPPARALSRPAVARDPPGRKSNEPAGRCEPAAGWGAAASAAATEAAAAPDRWPSIRNRCRLLCARVTGRTRWPISAGSGWNESDGTAAGGRLAAETRRTARTVGRHWAAAWAVAIPRRWAPTICAATCSRSQLG